MALWFQRFRIFVASMAFALCAAPSAYGQSFYFSVQFSGSNYTLSNLVIIASETSAGSNLWDVTGVAGGTINGSSATGLGRVTLLPTTSNYTFTQQFQNPGPSNFNFTRLVPGGVSVGFTLRTLNYDVVFYASNSTTEVILATNPLTGSIVAPFATVGDVTLQNIGAVPMSVGAGALSSLLFGLGVVGAILGRRRWRSRLRA